MSGDEERIEAAVAKWKESHECDELGLRIHDGAVQCFEEGWNARTAEIGKIIARRK